LASNIIRLGGRTENLVGLIDSLSARPRRSRPIWFRFPAPRLIKKLQVTRTTMIAVGKQVSFALRPSDIELVAKDVARQRGSVGVAFAGPVDTFGTLSARRDIVYHQFGGCRCREFGSAVVRSSCQCLRRRAPHAYKSQRGIRLGPLGIGTRPGALRVESVCPFTNISD
jgi:hypothetical protein